MPVPKWLPTDKLATLLSFKDKHHDELVRFRRHIEEHLIFLEEMPENDRKASMERFIQDSSIQIQDIEEKMKHTFGQIFFGSICSLAAGVIPMAAALIAREPAALAASIPSVLSAVYNIYMANGEKISTNDTLAYAALTNTRFNNYRR